MSGDVADVAMNDDQYEIALWFVNMCEAEDCQCH